MKRMPRDCCRKVRSNENLKERNKARCAELRKIILLLRGSYVLVRVHDTFLE
jgi:hypothetical protein